MSPVVERALGVITDRTNLETGLTHPNDKNAAKELLRMLHRDGETLPGDEIASWAANHGWKAKDAAELGKLAGRIGSGRKVIIKGDPYWVKDIIDKLRAPAQT